jgi:hypothetical protein
MEVVKVWVASMGVLLATGVAAAQPSETPTMESYRLEAREAALHGQCKTVASIAEQVRKADAAYYANVFLHDPVIVSCDVGVGGAQLPPPSAVPEAAAPETGAAAVVPITAKGWHLSDTGRGMLGLGAGMGLGAVFGALGATLGVAVAHRKYHCGEICDEELLPAALVGQVGMSAGLALGATLVGNHQGGKGSFATSLGLGLAGSAASWLFALDSRFIDSGAWGVSFFLFPVVGTTAGYWVTHVHTSVTVVPTVNGVSVVGRF